MDDIFARGSGGDAIVEAAERDGVGRRSRGGGVQGEHQGAAAQTEDRAGADAGNGHGGSGGAVVMDDEGVGRQRRHGRQVGGQGLADVVTGGGRREGRILIGERERHETPVVDVAHERVAHVDFGHGARDGLADRPREDAHVLRRTADRTPAAEVGGDQGGVVRVHDAELRPPGGVRGGAQDAPADVDRRAVLAGPAVGDDRRDGAAAAARLEAGVVGAAGESERADGLGFVGVVVAADGQAADDGRAAPEARRGIDREARRVRDTVVRRPVVIVIKQEITTVIDGEGGRAAQARGGSAQLEKAAVDEDRAGERGRAGLSVVVEVGITRGRHDERTAPGEHAGISGAGGHVQRKRMRADVHQALVLVGLTAAAGEPADRLAREQLEGRGPRGRKIHERGVPDGAAAADAKHAVLNLGGAGIAVLAPEKQDPVAGLGQGVVDQDVGGDLEDLGAVLGEDQFRHVAGERPREERAVRDTGAAADVRGDEHAAAGDAERPARSQDQVRTGRSVETQAQGGGDGHRSGETVRIADVLARDPGRDGVALGRDRRDDVTVGRVGRITREEDTAAVVDGEPASEDGGGAGAQAVRRVRGHAVGGRLGSRRQHDPQGAVLRVDGAGQRIEVKDDAVAGDGAEIDDATSSAAQREARHRLGHARGGVTVQREHGASHIERGAGAELGRGVRRIIEDERACVEQADARGGQARVVTPQGDRARRIFLEVGDAVASQVGVDRAAEEIDRAAPDKDGARAVHLAFIPDVALAEVEPRSLDIERVEIQEANADGIVAEEDEIEGARVERTKDVVGEQVDDPAGARVETVARPGGEGDQAGPIEIEHRGGAGHDDVVGEHARGAGDGPDTGSHVEVGGDAGLGDPADDGAFGTGGAGEGQRVVQGLRDRAGISDDGAAGPVGRKGRGSSGGDRAVGRLAGGAREPKRAAGQRDRRALAEVARGSADIADGAELQESVGHGHVAGERIGGGQTDDAVGLRPAAEVVVDREGTRPAGLADDARNVQDAAGPV